MTMYAYEDEERTKEIKSEEAAQKDRNIRYYCPNHKCQAKLYIWGVDGEKKVYFRSNGEPGHVKHCFGGSENSYNPNKTKIDDFVANDIISKMMIVSKEHSETSLNKPQVSHDREKKEEITPHTIRQVYDMCKSYSCGDCINNQEIGYILYDERSAFMSPKGIYGNRLIEAKCRRYLYNGQSIFLETPITDAQYELELKIHDKELFRKVREKLFNNRDKVIVVAGDWRASNTWNRFVTEFNTMKQIKVLRQTI